MLATFSIGVPLVHLAPYAQDKGVSEYNTSLLQSLMGVGSTVGRLGLGFLADKIGKRKSFISTTVCIGILLFCWPSANSFGGSPSIFSTN